MVPLSKSQVHRMMTENPWDPMERQSLSKDINTIFTENIIPWERSYACPFVHRIIQRWRV